jgi:ADP-dependent NAD(P)H-hydrate dehydratase / NAD(P)H-hydrate epimerase
MRVLTAAEMQTADGRTIEELGIPAAELMDRAGRAVAAEVVTLVTSRAATVSVLCGRGNNGGDGLVAVRVLAEAGVRARAYDLGGFSGMRDDARAVLAGARAAATVVEIPDLTVWQQHRADAFAADLIVDAISGTGFTPPLTGLPLVVVNDVNRASKIVVAVDLPSGLSADTGGVSGAAIRATSTVALAAPKLPHVLPPALDLVGAWRVADIGIPVQVIEEIAGARLDLVTAGDVREIVRPRAADAHKGDFGHVLIVAGSRGKTGAAYLAGMGALRSGAGLVTIAAPASSAPVIAALAAEYMTLALPEDADGRLARSALQVILEFDADVIAIGPGLGQSTDVTAVVAGVVEGARVPLVIDADGLNALSDDVRRLASRRGPDIVMTPHPGEMARLSGQSTAVVQADRLAVARAFAAAHDVHVVLKGRRSVIAAPDGRAAINPTGNPGMATGGTGDVLTGAVAAWIAQLRRTGQVMPAAIAATYLHGRAGDLAAEARGEVALIAGDVVDHLGAATLELGRAAPEQAAPR